MRKGECQPQSSHAHTKAKRRRINEVQWRKLAGNIEILECQDSPSLFRKERTGGFTSWTGISLVGFRRVAHEIVHHVMITAMSRAMRTKMRMQMHHPLFVSARVS
jgi:hypothetical protein